MAIQTKDRIVELPFDLAQELLQSKMKEIRKRIETILLKWNQEDPDVFQQLTREGNIPEAEMDAISIGNLMERLQELEKIYTNL